MHMEERSIVGPANMAITRSICQRVTGCPGRIAHVIPGIGVSLVLLLPGTGGFAHHSFAPHFNSDDTLSISGTITEFEARNPHVYLHIDGTEGDGQTQAYVCESGGISTLERNGLTRDMFPVGASIRIDGVRSRRDPNFCFFRTVHLADGRTLNTSGNDRDSVADAALPRRTSIEGTWMIIPAGRSSSGPWEMIDYLTPEGEAAVAEYDPFLDDPTLRCSPVGIRRVWSAPSEPLNIRLEDDAVIIHHEWMDTVRTIHLDAVPPADVAPSTLGNSVGRFEDGVLVVETTNFASGVLRQYVQEEGQPTRGLLHSDELRVVERIGFDAETQMLNVLVERTDPKFFTRDFIPISIDYAPSNVEIAHFGCVPEV